MAEEIHTKIGHPTGHGADHLHREVMGVTVQLRVIDACRVTDSIRLEPNGEAAIDLGSEMNVPGMRHDHRVVTATNQKLVPQHHSLIDLLVYSLQVLLAPHLIPNATPMPLDGYPVLPICQVPMNSG